MALIDRSTLNAEVEIQSSNLLLQNSLPAWEAGSNIRRRHWASSLSIPYPTVLSSSNPASAVLVFLLYSCPPFFSSMTLLSGRSPLSVWPIHFLYLFQIVYIRALSSPILYITSTLAFMFRPADILHSPPCPHLPRHPQCVVKLWILTDPDLANLNRERCVWGVQSSSSLSEHPINSVQWT